MGTPAFPVYSPAKQKIYAPARQQAGLLTAIYGTNSSDAVNYGMASVANTDQIKTSKITDIANKAIEEKVRRGGSSIQIPAGYYEGKIIGSRIQDIRLQLERKGPAATQAYNYPPDQGINSGDGKVATGTQTVITGYDYYGQPVYGTVTTYSTLADPTVIVYPQAASPTMAYSFASPDKITAQNINTLITEINNAGAVCLCNCNYCTCNCNYCTCNCNYTCTCNCNY